MDDDRKLLAAYARDGSEEAFSTLTARYLDLVFSAAQRQLGNADQARDVAQAVFLLLARKAKSLAPETVLAGWLYQTARLVSMEAVRAERRRKIREENMASAVQEDSSSEAVWQQVSPHLDDAMEQISESDRTAIILRYFEDRPLRELAAILGLSEEAARKRVSRALEKLRLVLAREGIKSTGSLLGTALLASAVQPTPPALAAVVLTGAGAPAVAVTAQILVKGTIGMMTYSKIQAGAAAAVLLLMAGGTGYVGIQQVQARREQARDLASSKSGAEQSAEISASQREALEQAGRENQQLREQALELYRLRDSVTQLRAAQARQTSAPPAALNLHEAPRELQESAEKLRELQYERFMAAGRKAINLQPLTEEEENRYAFEVNFLKNIGLALRIYSTDHGDEFPATIETLLTTDLLNDKLKEQLQSGKYEYIQFKNAESKPSLPAVWWRVADENGIRIIALNDGSVQKIREPMNFPKPGYIALAEPQKH